MAAYKLTEILALSIDVPRPHCSKQAMYSGRYRRSYGSSYSGRSYSRGYTGYARSSGQFSAPSGKRYGSSAYNKASTGGTRRYRYGRGYRGGLGRGLAMKTMVKDTVERLGGLQQRDWFTYFVDSSTQLAMAVTWSGLNTGGYLDLIRAGVIPSTGDDKVTLRYMEAVVWFTNAGNFPVVLMYWEAVARKTTTQTYTSMLNTGNQVTGIPFGDMTRNSTFRRFFNIEKRGMRILKAGECVSIRTAKYFPGGKVIQPNIEGVQDTNEGLTRLLLWQLNSVPIMFKTSGGTMQTQVGAVAVNRVMRQHYSFTKPQLSDPSYVVSGFTPVLAAPGCEVISNKVIAKAVDLYDNFI